MYETKHRVTPYVGAPAMHSWATVNASSPRRLGLTPDGLRLGRTDLDLGDDRLLTRVHRAIHGGHAAGGVEDVRQVPWLDVNSNVGGVDVDEEGKLLIGHLMLIPEPRIHRPTTQYLATLRSMLGPLPIRTRDSQRLT